MTDKTPSISDNASKPVSNAQEKEAPEQEALEQEALEQEALERRALPEMLLSALSDDASATPTAAKEIAIDRLIAAFEDTAQVTPQGVEFWTARTLQGLLGYAKWDSFLTVIAKAKATCLSSGQAIEDHFSDVRKMVPIGSGAERDVVVDINLTRYACYIIAQNGDSRKKQIAFAQTYFAIQTRRQEIAD